MKAKKRQIFRIANQKLFGRNNNAKKNLKACMLTDVNPAAQTNTGIYCTTASSS